MLFKIQTLKIDVRNALSRWELYSLHRVGLTPCSLPGPPLQSWVSSAVCPPGHSAPDGAHCPQISQHPTTPGCVCSPHSPFQLSCNLGFPTKPLCLFTGHLRSSPNSRAFPRLHSPGPHSCLILEGTFLKFTHLPARFPFHPSPLSLFILHPGGAHFPMLNPVPLVFSPPCIPQIGEGCLSFLRLPRPPLCWRLQHRAWWVVLSSKLQTQEGMPTGQFHLAIPPWPGSSCSVLDSNHQLHCALNSPHQTVLWTSGQRPGALQILSGTQHDVLEILWVFAASDKSSEIKGLTAAENLLLPPRSSQPQVTAGFSSSAFSLIHPSSGLLYTMTRQSLNHPIIESTATQWGHMVHGV